MRKYKYIIIFILLLTSCATRKVNKSTEEIKTNKIETTQNNVQIKENTDIKVVDSTDEICIEPIDILKPIVIDGKSYFNAKISHKKRKVNTSIVSDKTTSDLSEKKIVEKVDFKKNGKFIERKSGFNWWWLLLLLIPFGVYIYVKL
jgi:PBP1b-binding outer membrane lipoprotein LpoB